MLLRAGEKKNIFMYTVRSNLFIMTLQVSEGCIIYFIITDRRKLINLPNLPVSSLPITIIIPYIHPHINNNNCFFFIKIDFKQNLSNRAPHTPTHTWNKETTVKFFK